MTGCSNLLSQLIFEVQGCLRYRSCVIQDHLLLFWPRVRGPTDPSWGAPDPRSWGAPVVRGSGPEVPLRPSSESGSVGELQHYTLTTWWVEINAYINTSCCHQHENRLYGGKCRPGDRLGFLWRWVIYKTHGVILERRSQNWLKFTPPPLVYLVLRCHCDVLWL